MTERQTGNVSSPGGGSVGATTRDFWLAGGRGTGTRRTIGRASTIACSSADTGDNCFTA